jgi:hypothetical protein
MALSIKADRSQLYCNISYNNRDYGADVGGWWAGSSFHYNPFVSNNERKGEDMKPER